MVSCCRIVDKIHVQYLTKALTLKVAPCMGRFTIYHLIDTKKEIKIKRLIKDTPHASTSGNVPKCLSSPCTDRDIPA